MLASLLGYAGSQFKPQLLLAYLIVGAVGTVAQLIIVLAIFFAQAEVASAIENMNTEGSVTAAYIKEKDRCQFPCQVASISRRYGGGLATASEGNFLEVL